MRLLLLLGYARLCPDGNPLFFRLKPPQKARFRIDKTGAADYIIYVIVRQ